MFDTDCAIGLKKGKVPIKDQHFYFHRWQNSISPTQMNPNQIFERQNHNRLGFQPLIFMIVIFIIKASAVVAVIEAVWFNYWQCETRDHTLGACGTVLLSLNIIVDIFRKLVIFFITVFYIHTANNCNFVTSRTTSCQCGFQGHIIPLKMRKVAKPEVHKHY